MAIEILNHRGMSHKCQGVSKKESGQIQFEIDSQSQLEILTKEDNSQNEMQNFTFLTNIQLFCGFLPKR